MRCLLNLESFDPSELTDPGPSQDYQDGLAAGLAAGRDAALAEADRLSCELVQVLTDTTFTYTEARQDVMSSLTTLITALTETILPHLVAHGFATQVAELVLDRFVDGRGEAIHIHVHPDQTHAVRLATQEIANLVVVKIDPTLTPHAAWISHSGLEAHLDMDQHLADISDILANVSKENQRVKKNG